MHLKWNEVTWYSKWGTIILLVVIVPFILYVVDQKYQDLKAIEKSYSTISNFQPTILGDVTYKYSTSTISNSAVDYNISIPIVSLSSNKIITKRINDGISANVQKIITNHQANTLPCSDDEGRKCKSTVDLTSTTSISIKFNSIGIAINSFVTSEQLAHPDFEREAAVNFDLITGKEKQYYEILGIDQSVLLKKLSEKSIEKLKESFPKGTFTDIDAFNKGTEPKPENYKYVILDDEGLRVFFDYYQIGPRPVGAPEVFIKYSELGF